MACWRRRPAMQHQKMAEMGTITKKRNHKKSLHVVRLRSEEEEVEDPDDMHLYTEPCRSQRASVGQQKARTPTCTG